jgi:hypothetical protein
LCYAYFTTLAARPEFLRIQLRTLSVGMLSKDATLAFKPIVKEHSRSDQRVQIAYPITIYRVRTLPKVDCSTRQWTEADKAVNSLLDWAALPASGHLRWLFSADELPATGTPSEESQNIAVGEDRVKCVRN